MALLPFIVLTMMLAANVAAVNDGTVAALSGASSEFLARPASASPGLERGRLVSLGSEGTVQLWAAGEARAPRRGDVSVSVLNALHLNLDGSAVVHMNMVYDVQPGMVLVQGSRSILTDSRRSHVSGLQVTDDAGRLMPFNTSDEGDSTVVIFEFLAPELSEIRQYPTVHLRFTIHNALCGGWGQHEVFRANWTGVWDIPVTRSTWRLEFNPSIFVRLDSVCLVAPPNRYCGQDLVQGEKSVELTAAGRLLDVAFTWPPLLLRSHVACTDLGPPHKGFLNAMRVSLALTGIVALCLICVCVPICFGDCCRGVHRSGRCGRALSGGVVTAREAPGGVYSCEGSMRRRASTGSAGTAGARDIGYTTRS